MQQFQPFSLNLKGRLLEADRPLVMGILNVTPDSFYDGSRSFDADTVSRRVEQMVVEGADIIDIGAYSSRPGADDVSIDEELKRLNMGMTIVRRITPDITVSVDTFRARVARVAVNEMDANIINDISGGDLDPDMFDTVAELAVPYVLMHMRGTPATMQSMTDYNDVTADVITDLSVKLNRLNLAGAADVIIDPGFGFSKTLDDNYRLMESLPTFGEAFPGRPLLVGVSRKSMLTRLLGIAPDDALNATTALNTIAMTLGASILRVHDVKACVEAVKVASRFINAHP